MRSSAAASHLELQCRRADPETDPPAVWAIGGGKGGVGKSVVASNLAIALAARGESCAVVDADLGGANLHTLFGVDRPRRTLSHFLDGVVPSLSDVMSPTSIPDVWLVAGAGAGNQVANLRYSTKAKLLRHLRSLPVSNVILDVGAGSAFNVVDFFLAADRGILVVAPEPTSVENAYHFLKAAFFRSLRGAARDPSVRAVLQIVLGDQGRNGLTPRELVHSVGARDPAAGRLLQERVQAFAPFLILNQVDREEHRQVGMEMRAACADHLGVELGYLGALEFDAAVPASVIRHRPVLQLYPGCAFARSLNRLSLRVRRGSLPDPETWPRRPLFRSDVPPVATHGLITSEVEVVAYR
jgi:flagellar biosynthesis protein FlhG